MLGGGIFVTQNKTLPGSYINVINASSVGSNIGTRGVVAIALPLGVKPGKVIEITKSEFVTDCKNILGKEYSSNEMKPLREIFCHASKVIIFDLGTNEVYAPEQALSAFEAYEFNILCCNEYEPSNYADVVKSWRDELGKKCQVVIGFDYDSSMGELDSNNHEGVIEVVDLTAVPWVAGAMASCKINESCTNMLYDGECDITHNYAQSELEKFIQFGKIAFHLVYGEVRLLEDINSLTKTTADKGEDFKSNQTIRVIDQVANDIAKLYNTKYLGRIPNNASGRVSLWADIVAHHRELESINAIENFDATLVTVEQGATKKSVVVNDCITVTNTMAQLYMTVVIK